MNQANSCVTSSQAVIFLHIPKTAGQTFSSILDCMYPSKSIAKIYAPNLAAPYKRTINLSYDEKIKLKLIRGHMGFGIHKHLPQKSMYVTFLRDPIDRVISAYHYELRATFQPQHRMVKQMTLKQFAVMTDDQQTRLLCGSQNVDSIHGHDPVTRFHLCAAKRNLKESFGALGIVEHFDESLLIFKKAFGWKDPYYVSRNVGGRQAHAVQYLPETLDVIREHNQLDYELYEYAVELFDAQIRAYGETFDQDLSLFKEGLENFIGQIEGDSLQYEPIQNAVHLYKPDQINDPWRISSRLKDIKAKMKIGIIMLAKSRMAKEIIIKAKGIKLN